MFEMELFICIEMDLALNNLQWLLYNKTKPNQIGQNTHTHTHTHTHTDILTLPTNAIDWVCRIGGVRLGKEVKSS